MSNDRARAVVEGFLRDVARVLEQAQGRRMSDADRESLRQTLEDLRRSVAEILQEMGAQEELGWSAAQYADVEEIKRCERQQRPLVIRASVRTLGEVLSIMGQDTADAVLKGSQCSDHIPTASLVDPLLGLLQRLRRRYAILDFLGFSLLVPTGVPGVRRYIFVIVDIRPPEKPLQVVMASPGEIALADGLLAELAGSGAAPIDWLRQEVVELLGIRGMGGMSLVLDELLEAVLLQALSDNYVGNANGRIHSLVIGPPASGKKLLVEAGRLLNLAFQHAGHKITPAGLIGNARMGRGGTYVCEPGLLPKAHRGLFVLEDFHAVTASRFNGIWGHLAQVMEDGEVHDSTSAKVTLRANTSVHLDCNRASDLYPGKRRREADFDKLPTNVISRFDVVYDYPKDADWSADIAVRMLRETEIVGPDRRAEQKERIRKMRLVVATLRERIPEVSMPRERREQAMTFIADLRDRLRNEPRTYDLLAMFLTRMANSLLKLAAARARGHARDTVTADDVDKACLFLRRKVEFIRRLVDSEEQSRWSRRQRERQDAARDRFDDEEFTARDYEDASGASPATAYRDIEEFMRSGLVRRIGHGRYRFSRKRLPPPEVGAPS